jgi:hypothetical protein
MDNIKSDDNNETSTPELSLMKTISDAGMRDSLIDVSEVGLDKLLKNLQDETLSQIPIVKSVYSLVKSGFAVRDYRFLKKLFLFISGIKKVDDKFKKSLEQKYMDLEHKKKLGLELMNALDIFDQVNKADSLFKIFAAYVKDEITYQQFSQYSYVLQNIDLNNLNLLSKFYYAEKYHPESSKYLSWSPDMTTSAKEVRENWHLLQGFISVGLVSLSLGSTSKSSGSIPLPITLPGELKSNHFGGKFLQILGLLKLEN